MKRPSLRDSLRFMFGEAWMKIALVFAGAALALAAAYALGFVPDPWLRRGQGPGWECDATRPGARICARDVPQGLQKPRGKTPRV